MIEDIPDLNAPWPCMHDMSASIEYDARLWCKIIIIKNIKGRLIIVEPPLTHIILFPHLFFFVKKMLFSYTPMEDST